LSSVRFIKTWADKDSALRDAVALEQLAGWIHSSFSIEQAEEIWSLDPDIAEQGVARLCQVERCQM
jgi:hypothetical protein